MRFPVTRVERKGYRRKDGTYVKSTSYFIMGEGYKNYKKHMKSISKRR